MNVLRDTSRDISRTKAREVPHETNARRDLGTCTAQSHVACMTRSLVSIAKKVDSSTLNMLNNEPVRQNNSDAALRTSSNQRERMMGLGQGSPVQASPLPHIPHLWLETYEGGDIYSQQATFVLRHLRRGRSSSGHDSLACSP